MAIKMQNRIDPTFSATSMSDLVFLLLIFFMLTSTMISPNAINLVLPKSTAEKQLSNRQLEVYIAEYSVNSTFLGSTNTNFISHGCFV